MEFSVIERKEVVKEDFIDDYLENKYITKIIDRLGIKEYLKIICDDMKQVKTIRNSIYVTFLRKKIEIRIETVGRILYIRKIG